MAEIVSSIIVFGSVYAQGDTKLSDPEIASVAVVANQIDINYAKIAKTRSKNADILKFAQTMADDPLIAISCLEAVIGVRYTVDTISYLRRRASGLRFVWIMGADSLAQFHRWQNWRRIASEVPIAVIDRPPQRFRALAAPAAQALAPQRLPMIRAAPLPQ